MNQGQLRAVVNAVDDAVKQLDEIRRAVNRMDGRLKAIEERQERQPRTIVVNGDADPDEVMTEMGRHLAEDMGE